MLELFTQYKTLSILIASLVLIAFYYITVSEWIRLELDDYLNSTQKSKELMRDTTTETIRFKPEKKSKSYLFSLALHKARKKAKGFK